MLASYLLIYALVITIMAGVSIGHGHSSEHSVKHLLHFTTREDLDEHIPMEHVAFWSQYLVVEGCQMYTEQISPSNTQTGRLPLDESVVLTFGIRKSN